jgi:hypothetical protein
MGIKLNIMRIYLFIFLVVLITFSCTNKTINQRKNKFYINYFKDKVLCECIIAGLNDKEIRDKFLSEDKSFNDRVVYYLFDSLSKEIIKPTIEKIRLDSIESEEILGEGSAGKNVFNECLKFYKSKKLDSIAKTNNKKWIKINNLDSLIDKKYPIF